MRRGRRALAFAAVLLLAAAPAVAEVRVMQAEGAAPVVEGAPPNVTALRNAAVQAALAQAVRQVAVELAGASGDPAAEARVAASVKRPLDATVGYRILEDRGLGPRRLLTDPAVTREYAVKVEARVETAKLQSAGAAPAVAPGASATAPAPGTPAPPSAPAPARLRLVLMELPSFGALGTVEQTLEEAGLAQSVSVVEFARRQATLEIATPRSPEELVAGLKAALPADLSVEPAGGEGETLRLRIGRPGAAPAAAAPPTAAD